MDVPEHGQIMEYLRFFGPVLSIVVIGLLVYGVKLYRDIKKRPETLEGTAAEATDGRMKGRDVYLLIMDLKDQVQNLTQGNKLQEKDYQHFVKTLEKLAEIVEKDHDLLIELKAKHDATK